MKCYYHNTEDAVAVCEDCGKYLCKKCSENFTMILCKDCANERLEKNKLTAKKTYGFQWFYLLSEVFYL